MLEKTKFRAMGCSILTVLDCPSPPDIFPEIPRWFDEWEEHLSRFRSHSELSKVNRSNGIPTRVSPIFADVLEKAIEAEKLSEVAGPMLEEWSTTKQAPKHATWLHAGLVE